VPKAGEYYLNKGAEDEPTTLDQLGDFLKQLHDADPHRKLVLRGDENLEYGEVRGVMARVQGSGYPGISFLVGKIHVAGESETGEVAVTTERAGIDPAGGAGAPGDAPPADAGAAPAGAGAAPADAGAGAGNMGQGS
jgi:hypothetical protein